MEIIKKVQGHLKEMVEWGIEDEANDIVLRNADRIIKVLQDRQLGKGMYYDNSLLGTYSPYTQELADEESRAITEKPYGEPYNFQWTGGTFFRMFLKSDIEDNGFDIFTRDSKQELLKNVYGDKLFKLSEENNQWINENIIEPELVKYVEENWFLID